MHKRPYGRRCPPGVPLSESQFEDGTGCIVSEELYAAVVVAHNLARDGKSYAGRNLSMADTMVLGEGMDSTSPKYAGSRIFSVLRMPALSSTTSI